jgi:hypothetical protein
MNRLFFTLLITGVGLAQPQQAPTEKQGLKLRVVRVMPRPYPKPEEGDKFQLDPATGDLLIEFKRPDGTLETGRIEVATKVRPEVNATWEIVGNSLVRYAYYLSNGQGAEQNIELFAVAMSSPELISNVQAPPGWRATGPSLATWGTPSRYNWDPTNYFESGGLHPGSRTGPYSFENPHLPGLTHLYVQGFVETDVPASLQFMSEWLHEQGFQKTRFENNSVKPPTIGPVIPIGPHVQADEVISGIRSQLLSVLGQRQFRDIEPQLTNLVNLFSSGDRTTIVSLRPTIALMGTTPLQKAFFSAIAFDLDYVSKMQ